MVAATNRRDPVANDRRAVTLRSPVRSSEEAHRSSFCKRQFFLMKYSSQRSGPYVNSGKMVVKENCSALISTLYDLVKCLSSVESDRQANLTGLPKQSRLTGPGGWQTLGSGNRRGATAAPRGQAATPCARGACSSPRRPPRFRRGSANAFEPTRAVANDLERFWPEIVRIVLRTHLDLT